MIKELVITGILLLLYITPSFSQKIFSVTYSNQADVKVFVVDYKNQADLLIYFVKYSNQAKWMNKEKIHLMY